jgi:hypothetical protein
MPNKLLVRNPAFSEFIYDILYNLTYEQKKKLSKPFLYVAKSEIKSKNFAEFSTIDEKLRFLSELGYENSLIIFQDKLQNINNLKEILLKYNKNKASSATQDVAAMKLFACSDKQVKWLLSMMSDSISHKSYFLNIDNADLTIKLILNASTSLGYVDSLIGLNAYQIKILLYLYGYRHTYIDKTRIWDYFAGDMTKGKVTSALKRLFLNDYISKHIDWRTRKYSITGLGIESVNRYVKRILDQTNF